MTAHVPGAARPLSTGDIVSFRFPHSDRSGQKDRPCLVIHTDDETGEAVLHYEHRFSRTSAQIFH